MAKLKTKRAAAKRFNKTPTGIYLYEADPFYSV
jgi:ribosomal protein L35